MSGTVAPLSDDEMAAVRDFCGYPVFGSGTTTDPFFRFETGYLQLESHMANLTSSELTLCRGYLADLATLKAALPAASALLYVGSAAVFTRNPNELTERIRLYSTWRRRLCGFLGVPPGPYLQGGGANIRLVV